LWTRLGYRDRIVPSRRPSSGIKAESEQNNLVSTSISQNGRCPKMDDATVQKLRDKSRKLENEGEEDIVQQTRPIYYSCYG
jgi:hypothetical protein